MDNLKLKFDIIKTKLFIFMAIAGGSWIYVLKGDIYVQILTSILILLASYGIVVNLIKLGNLEKRIDSE